MVADQSQREIGHHGEAASGGPAAPFVASLADFGRRDRGARRRRVVDAWAVPGNDDRCIATPRAAAAAGKQLPHWWCGAVTRWPHTRVRRDRREWRAPTLDPSAWCIARPADRGHHGRQRSVFLAIRR